MSLCPTGLGQCLSAAAQAVQACPIGSVSILVERLQAAEAKLLVLEQELHRLLQLAMEGPDESGLDCETEYSDADIDKDVENALA